MAVTPRDAATVMLVRDAVDATGGPAVEVCMLRRNLASEFVAGAYVFPGGSLDPADRSAEAAALCRGRSDDEASRLLGVDACGLAFWVAALRECFEESGVLVGRHQDGAGAGELLDTTDPDGLGQVRGPPPGAHRRADRASRRSADDEGLVLAADEMYYVSHWITPEVSPRAGTTPGSSSLRRRSGRPPATTTGRPSRPSGCARRRR